MLYLILLLLLGGIAWFLYEKRQRPTGELPPGLHEEILLPHEREWEIYENQLSFCSKKLRVCMQELGLDYVDQHIELVETSHYENLRRDYLRINPGFTVPVLVHHGHPIYESHEQIVYAAQHAGERGAELLGATPELRSQVNHWVEQGSLQGDPLEGDETRPGSGIPGLTIPLFATMIQYIPWSRLAEGVLFHGDRRRPLMFSAMKLLGLKKMPPPAVATIQKSRRSMSNHLDALEKLLSDERTWLCGDTFTLADINWMPIFERLDEADWSELLLNAEKRPAVAAYWARLKARPSYQKALIHRGEIHTRALQDIREAKRASPELRQQLEVD